MHRVGPFGYLSTKCLSRRRWRFDETYRTGEFPLIDKLKENGATEHFAYLAEVGEQTSLSAARMSHFPGCGPAGRLHGCRLALIERIAPALTCAINAARNIATGRMPLDTYPGTDAAERVLSGNVVHGRAESIRAAVWFSDLSDFTRISGETPAEEMLALLNGYADCPT